MISKIISFIVEKGLILGGLLMLVISGIILRNGYLDQQITEQNRMVSVEVLECESNGKSYFMKFTHKGEKFVKRTKYSYCQQIAGEDKVQLLTNSSEDRFIFKDELDKDNDYAYGSILAIMSLFIIYKGIKGQTK